MRAAPLHLLAALSVALVPALAAQPNTLVDSIPGFPRATDFPRDPDTWRQDRDVVNRLLNDHNAFDAFQPNTSGVSELVDVNYVGVGIPDAFPTLLSINNGFGGASTDTLVFGGFRLEEDERFVWSMYARQVAFDFVYDDTTAYPQYSWIWPFKEEGIAVSVHVQTGCRGAWSEILWHSDLWPEPWPESTNDGRPGFDKEWRLFDLTADVQLASEGEEFCLVVVMENRDGAEGSVFANLTWLVDHFTSYAVSVGEAPVLDSARLTIGPNPARGHVAVRGFSAADPLERVEVYDLLGRRVAVSDEAHLDLSGLPAGAYVVQIHTRTQTVARRLTKL